jgi:hypothetical protein
MIFGSLSKICESGGCFITPLDCENCYENTIGYLADDCCECGLNIPSLCYDCDMELMGCYMCTECYIAFVHTRCTPSGSWSMLGWRDWKCDDCEKKFIE